MKIRHVMEKTELTERTIRFYVENQLISPEKNEHGGRVFLEFTEENVARLKHIATLRKMEFSLEDIGLMLTHPDQIDEKVQRHLNSLKQTNREGMKTIRALEAVESHSCHSLDDLAELLQQAAVHRPLPPADIQPQFSRFDTETEKERQEAYLDFLVSMRLREKRESILRPIRRGLLLLGAMLLLLLLVVLISGIPKEVDVSYPAIYTRYPGDGPVPGDFEPTRIDIKGSFRHRLFDHPEFSGIIRLENFSHIDGYELIDLEFSRIETSLSAVITYSSIINHRPVLETVGILHTDRNFRRVMIQIFEPVTAQQKTWTDLYLLAPAETTEEAVGIYDLLTPDADR